MYEKNKRYTYVNLPDCMKIIITTKNHGDSKSKTYELLFDHDTDEQIRSDHLHITIKENTKKQQIRVQCYLKRGPFLDLSRWVLGVYDKQILVWFKESNLDFRKSNLRMIQKKGF